MSILNAEKEEEPLNWRAADVDSGQGGIPDLAAMLDGYEFVDARIVSASYRS